MLSSTFTRSINKTNQGPFSSRAGGNKPLSATNPINVLSNKSIKRNKEKITVKLEKVTSGYSDIPTVVKHQPVQSPKSTAVNSPT